ncbi:MAG: hypothetical protein DMF08_04115 [Verrucomicrobia bacterium]|nr:MAG: hypothetical protein DMF08_04115 [Verrucomicrobiota bacterium]
MVLVRAPAAKSVLTHRPGDSFPHLVVALAGDHALAAGTVHGRQPTAVWVSLLPVRLLHRVVGIVRLPGLALCHVQTAKAKRLHALPMAAVLCRHDVRLVLLLRMAKATRVLCLRRALPWPRAANGCRACLLRVQPVMANRLTRAAVLHPEARDRLCRAGQA